jgi:recombination protein RecT
MSESTQVAEVSYGDVIDKIEGDFNQLAPSNLQFKGERGYALQLLQNNDYLMTVAQSNPVSLAQAMRNVASIGLSLNPAKKQAYLIPRSVKSGGKYVNKVFLEPSYMGMCDLATGLGTIAWIQARVVYKNDEFTDNGVGLPPTHKYDAFGSLEDRGEFVGTYCVAKTKDGDHLTTTMNKQAIETIRGKSEQYKKSGTGPWKDHFEEQAKKTVVRNAFKMWPKGEHMDRLEQAIHMSNENEGFEPIVTAPNLSSFTPEQKQYFDNCISSSDAIRMFCFMTSLDQGVQTNLYNSFEKGTITKYKQIVTGLIMKGQSLFVDIKTALEEAAASDDELAAKELLEDLPQEAIDYIKEKTDSETSNFISQCLMELAA